VVSFVFVAIYWNNHHHLLKATKRISGAVMWANIHLLFWLSLVPVTTAWVGDNHHYEYTGPVAAYGFVALMAGVAYYILVQTILRVNKDSRIVDAIGKDVKGTVSAVLYLVGAIIAFFNTYVAIAIYVMVSIIWLVPDRRLKQLL
jgi:uncharacterized membrane protein